ncbi:MAG: glucosaminidase domain-containing protein [Bacteroidota bacterium]
MHRDRITGRPQQWRTQQTGRAPNQKRVIQNQMYYTTIRWFRPIEWSKKVLKGLQQLYVALKFQFFRLTGGIFAEMQLSWFKMAMMGLILFAFFKKDFSFQMNMQAPAQVVQASQNDKMGLAKAVSWTATKPHHQDFAQLSAIQEDKVIAYIKRFRKVARTEMQKYGIPASIKMAQGILESLADTHPNTRKNNNHFGSFLADKSYNSAWENWRAHSIFITQSRFKTLLKHENNSDAWAVGFQQMRYTTDPDYSNKLLKIIDRYNLKQLDQ